MKLLACCGAVGARTRRHGERGRVPGRADGRAGRRRFCRAPRCRTPRARSRFPSALLSPPAVAETRVPTAARALATLRLRLRGAVAGAGRDQQGRVELRPQHGPELRRRDRLDAVHAVDVAALGRRRRRRRDREPVEPRRRDRRGGALPRRERRRDRYLPRSLRVQPRAWYVDEVLQLAQLFGSGGVDATFDLDRLQVSLDGAREKSCEREARARPPRPQALERTEQRSLVAPPARACCPTDWRSIAEPPS